MFDPVGRSFTWFILTFNDAVSIPKVKELVSSEMEKHNNK
jgi:hypothetical protein